MKLIKAIIIAMVTITILVTGFFIWRHYWNKVEVSNFEQCEAAGYPVGESFPRVCFTPDGTSYTEQ